MCCKDLEIGRNSGAKEHSVAVPSAASGLVLGPSPNRIAIILLQTTANRVHLTTDGSAVTGKGVSITHDSRPIEIHTAIWGSVVQKAWQGIADTGATILSLVEVFNNTCKEE